MPTVLRALILVLIFAFSSLQAIAQDATVYSSSGSVQFKSSTQTEWSDLPRGATLSFGDEVRTGQSARVGIKLASGKLLRLRANSYLKLAPPRNDEEKSGRLTLSEGVMYLFSRSAKESPEVNTPEVSAAIRGTEVVVSTSKGSTTVSVLEGEAEISNAHGAVRLQKGQQGSATKNSAPTRGIIANPTDAVQWALYYPSVLSIADFSDVYADASETNRKAFKELLDGEFGAASKNWDKQSWQGNFGMALATLLQGDLDQAAAQSTKIQNSAARQVITAAIGLQTGEVQSVPQTGNFEAAVASLKATNLAQQAIVALVRNEKVPATLLIQSAQAAKSDSVAALLAKAYERQSNFDIDSAREAIDQALQADPKNPQVLARAAELDLADGELHKSTERAQEAYRISPSDPGVLNILGYSYLTRYETARAKEYFQQALDSGADTASAHLGYGLALIRDGQLAEGREHIEQAVQLEPNRGIYRSYLGKAFFEEEREEQAQNEYALAMELDDSDPTPYLYRAFNNLSLNRPVSALSDVESSIERNDNRAVYRSKFLLDQDQAVRSTSLGEVFEQLGFEKIAELQALRSISQDYTNYTAHRLLGETLDGDFFSDARFTEGLISDLFAPVSFNVFQDFDGFNTDASLNDYSALFDRPQHRTGISFDATNENDFFSGNVFQTGKEGDFGYFLGYAGDYGDGSKSSGSYLRRQRFDLASQYQLDYDNRVLAQTGFTKRETGTQEVSDFDLEDFDVAIGSHHRFSPHSEIVTRLEYFDRDLNQFESEVARGAQESITIDGMDLFFDDAALLVDEQTQEEFEALRLSAQHVYNTHLVSFVTGAQYLDSDGKGEEQSLLLDDSAGFFTGLDQTLSSQGDFDAQSYTLYSYSTWRFVDWADLVLGANYTDLELPAYDVLAPYIDGERSADKFSPKAALSIYPSDSLIVRAAYFQNLGISSVSDIGTIEPAALGSFVQSYGDLPGVETENYGVGIDYKIPRTLYTGIEYIYRDIQRDAVEIDNTFDVNFDTLTQENGFRVRNLEEQEREHLVKYYLYGVISDELVATFDYVHAALNALDINERNDTDKFAFALRYFSPQRWFAFTRATYRQQGLRNVAGFENGDQDFWIVDAGLGYRIPKRHGSVQLIFSNLLDEDFGYADRGREAAFSDQFAARLVGSINF